MQNGGISSFIFATIGGTLRRVVAMLRSDRYIARQVLVTTVFAVAILSIVLVLGTLFKVARPMLVEDRASIWLVLKVLVSVMPATLMFTMPWGFLVAIMLVFSRLSADNEILSLRLAGHSLFRIALPALVIGLLLSVLSFYLNATVAPNSKAAQKDILYNTIQRDPGALLEPGIVQSRMKEGQVYVEQRNGSELVNFHFLKFDDGSEPEAKSEDDDEDDDASSLGDVSGNAYVFAQSASLQVDQDKQLLRLSLEGCYFETEDKKGQIQPIFADNLQPVLFDFAAFQRRGRDRPSGMTNAAIHDKIANPGDLSERKITKLEVELAKRYAFSGACFAFAAIGIPLALGRQRRDSSSGFGLSLAVAGVYFLLLIIGENTDEKAMLFMTLPNVLAVVIGFFLLARRDRR